MCCFFRKTCRSAIEAITQGYRGQDTDQLKEELVNEHVRRILMAKVVGWSAYQTCSSTRADHLYADLVNPAVKGLINDCYRAAITVVQDQRKLIPLRNLDTMDFASISVGEAGMNQTPFQKQLEQVCSSLTHFNLSATAHVG